MSKDQYRTHTSDAAGQNHEEKEKQQIDLLLEFFKSTRNYCVGIVDIVGSTTVTMKMPIEKVSLYYSIFLNGIAETIRKYGAIVVKNVGDSLLYYFPKTESGDPESFRDVLGCSIAMSRMGPELNARMQQFGLPDVKFRISCDYGAVIVAKMSTSSVNDIFGTSVNLCAKMNSLAPPGGIVIGKGLYDKVKSFDDYQFSEIKNVPLFVDNDYSVYSVSLKNDS